MTLLQVQDLRKVYKSKLGGKDVEALRRVNFQVEKGEFVAIMGDSGSGKTTLLNIIASLDRPSAGKVIISGQDLTALSDQDLTRFRRERLGFVFQDFKLLDSFNLADNILLPLVLAKAPLKEMQARLQFLASSLGLQDLLNKYPFELSGGEKQRGAIARALITKPDLVLADEPTGQLDSFNAQEILDSFAAIGAQGQTILMVTHSAKAAAEAGRVLFIRDGVVFAELVRAGKSHLEQMEAISQLMAQSSRRAPVPSHAQAR